MCWCATAKTVKIPPSEHNKCACKTAGVFYDANFVVVEVILDTATSWVRYSVLETKVDKWTREKFLYVDVYLAVS